MTNRFGDKGTRKVWGGHFSKKLPQSIQRVARRKLRMLNNAVGLDDIRIPPANRLEALSGSRLGQYSIRINEQYRVCFTWEDGHADEVEVTDYH